MSLYEAHRQFAWPTPEQILDPSGAGPNVFAQLAKDKLGKAIERLQDGAGVKVGVLAASPEDDATESPLAIVCEFQRTVSGKTLQEAHRLAWNFSYAPLLITIEPGLIRAWSCCEEPPAANEENPLKAQISKFELGTSKSHGDLSSQAARSLHWVQLVSGQYFKENKSRFKRDHCADYLLLENLKVVRQKLITKGLDQDICHDLVARIIFVQFLFHRKDSKGRPALDTTRLNRLYEEGFLSARYEELAEILANYDDSYALFQWLNNKFNGDLFPGKAQTEKERQAEWRLEKEKVKPEHLSLLADFVSGRIEVGSGQMSLWPQYSFDAIPIEFISSIYETFVGKKNGVVYTPGYLVDFILDGVLPWNDPNWDVKVLDPACGSGIFLVKAYQRLIHRWKKANRHQEPKTEVLRGLLERNLFGVDIDPHAVRVASFSLYLAMCDAIDPRHYWDQVKFPRLRERRLIASDFFADDKNGFRTDEDKGTYDLVIGNAPWGRNSVTPSSSKWNKRPENNWEVTYGDVGPLFLPKAAALLKKSGYVSMLQPAMALLFNQIDSAKGYRKRLFEEYNVDEILNLSALRFGLFSKAISPACIITMKSHPPTGEPLSYICPKPIFNSTEEYRVTIDPRDINYVYPHEAAEESLVWTVLMWGGRRDLAFIRTLLTLNNLENYEKAGSIVSRQGIIRGDRTKPQNKIIGRKILDTKEFPKNTFVTIKATSLPENIDPSTDSRASTNFEAFSLPQLIVKQGWQQKHRRFHAALIDSDKTIGAILCSKSYVSIHCKNAKILRSAWLSLNSKLAVYFLRLTSGRFCSYRPEPNVQDLLNIPIAEPESSLLENIKSYDDVDYRIRKALGVKESEWVLVEDLFDYTLPDFGTDNNTSAYALTRKSSNKNNETILESYCHSFLKVLRAGFGEDIKVSATIFQEQKASLPVRMVAVHFASPPDRGDVLHEPITSPDLLTRLQELDIKFMDISKAKGGIFYQRVVRVYDSVTIRERIVPTVYLIKPDQVRYWTRSMAFRDADDVAADALLWRKAVLPGVATDMEPRRA